MLKIYVLNGPNMNLLGKREQEIYGSQTLGDLQSLCVEHTGNRAELIFKQSNSEGKIIDFIHEAIEMHAHAIIINPAAYSHYSIAIMDALHCFKGVKVEVHLSDVMQREEFRQKLLTARSCEKMICGMGVTGYIMAIDYVLNE